MVATHIISRSHCGHLKYRSMCRSCYGWLSTGPWALTPEQAINHTWTIYFLNFAQSPYWWHQSWSLRVSTCAMDFDIFIEMYFQGPIYYKLLYYLLKWLVSANINQMLLPEKVVFARRKHNGLQWWIQDIPLWDKKWDKWEKNESKILPTFLKNAWNRQKLAAEGGTPFICQQFYLLFLNFVSIDGFLCKVISIILKCISGFTTFGGFLIINSKSLNCKYVWCAHKISSVTCVSVK